MTAHRLTATPRLPRRRAAFLFLATALTLGPLATAPVAATELDGFEGAAPPVRGGGVKGSGEAPAPEPTGRIIVRYRDGTSDATRSRVRAAAGLERAGEVALPNAELLEQGGGLTTQAITTLDAQPAVLYAEPEYWLRSTGGPVTEPLFGEQWALHNTGQEVEGFVGAPDVDMNAPEAWDITTGNPGLVVAVIDDGVDFTHPDLAGHAWVNPSETADGVDNDGNGLIDDLNGWDFCNGDSSVYDGPEFHGTHVAGSIAASGNGTGIAGVAPNVQIMALKFLDDDEDCGATTTTAVAAIAYAYAKGARIINASWGGYGFSVALRDAIAAADDALFVAAAGNDNVDNDVTPLYPASFDLPNVLSVAAVHNEGFLTQRSNYGARTVDLSAPGEAILSSIPGGTWQYLDGTSMAAANASGVAALAASAKPALLGNAAALHDHLIATAKALPNTIGWVRVPRLLDARAAVVSRPDVVRLAGMDRFATAAAISAATFTPGVPYVFIATGQNFPDALAGGALAAQLGSPLLLVRSGSIPPATAAELQRLAPAEIYIFGGSSAVSEIVAEQLRAYSTTDTVVRIAGPNRYATAAAIAAGFGAGVPNVYIATGLNFPDALAGVPASAALAGPLLLVRPTSIPPETAARLDSLDPQRIVILGGPGVVSESVRVALDDYTTGPVQRVAGATRYETAAAVAVFGFPTAETAYVASGLNFPDALAGGPAAGAYLGPLLLTTPGSLPGASAQQLQRLQPARVFILGGTSVISNAVVDQINALFP